VAAGVDEAGGAVGGEQVEGSRAIEAGEDFVDEGAEEIGKRGQGEISKIEDRRGRIATCFETACDARSSLLDAQATSHTA